MPFEAGFDDYQNLTFECGLNIISRKNDKVSDPLFVPFNVSVIVHPRDSASDKIHDKIVGQYDKWLSSKFFNWLLEDLTNYIDFIVRLCNFFMIFSTIAEIIYLSDATLGVVSEGKAFLAPISVALNTVNGVMEKMFTYMDYVVSPLCSFVTCGSFQLSHDYAELSTENCLKDSGGKENAHNSLSRFTNCDNNGNRLKGLKDGPTNKTTAYDSSADALSDTDAAAAGCKANSGFNAQASKCMQKQKFYEGGPVDVAEGGSGYEGWDAEETGDDGKWYKSAKSSKFNGRPQWCDTIFEYLEKAEKTVNHYAYGITRVDLPSNPKESIVFSGLCLCLPGFLDNLKRIRNFRCEYMTCLYEDTAVTTSPQLCEEKLKFSRCKYVFGELFAMIPIHDMFEQVINGLLEFLASPAAWLFAGVGIICSQMQGSSVVQTACQSIDIFFRVANVVDYFKKLDKFKGWTEPAIPDYCEPIRNQLETDPAFCHDIESTRPGKCPDPAEGEGGYESEEDDGTMDADDAAGGEDAGQEEAET